VASSHAALCSAPCKASDAFSLASGHAQPDEHSNAIRPWSRDTSPNVHHTALHVQGAAETLTAVLQRLEDHLQSASGSSDVDCVSANGIAVRRGGVAGTTGPVHLMHTPGRCAASARESADAAAERAASLNADKGNAGGYAASSASDSGAGLAAHVTLAQAATLKKEDVADTTGAGDSFIGSVIYGIVTGMKHERMLQLAAVVAACKCTALGARPGLPHRSNLAAELLG